MKQYFNLFILGRFVNIGFWFFGGALFFDARIDSIFYRSFLLFCLGGAMVNVIEIGLFNVRLSLIKYIDSKSFAVKLYCKFFAQNETYLRYNKEIVMGSRKDYSYIVFGITLPLALAVCFLGGIIISFWDKNYHNVLLFNSLMVLCIICSLVPWMYRNIIKQVIATLSPQE